MAVRATLRHLSQYRFERPAVLGPHILRLKPAPHAKAKIIDYNLSLSPSVNTLHWQQDPIGNWQARVLFPEKTRVLDIDVRMTVERIHDNPFNFLVAPEGQHLPFKYAPDLADSLSPYMTREAGGARFKKFLASFKPSEAETISYLVEINQRIHDEFKYRMRDEPDTQSAEQTLSLKGGACRDLAWLMTQTLRGLGLAARYVSGYSIHWDSLEEQSAELHAWTEAYLPGAGWIGFDPTAGLLAGDGHVPLSAAAHFQQAAPIEGTSDVAASRVSFSVSVAQTARADGLRLAETERAALHALGDRIDADLKAQDVRLTMGGEPTFVAVDDPEAHEWTLGALGPTKARYADQLLRRLRARFAPQGLMLHGKGKQYPGEAAPRWAYSLIWRADGAPIWRDSERIAREDTPPADLGDAKKLANAIAARLGVGHGHVIDAFEDPAHWITRESELPVNVEPGDPRLAGDAYRAALARKLKQGLDQPAGFIIPLRRVRDDALPSAWRSEKWKLRRGDFVLFPGDAPIGDRLPMASLAWLAPNEFPLLSAPDPSEAPSPLPARPEPEKGVAHDSEPVRTALAIEARDGKLCVFMPPVERLEHYLELLSAIEDAATHIGAGLRLEGYPPPHDARLKMLSVTPDPGVIEVNVHPAAEWREASAIISGVYEDAEAVGLQAEKFFPDGRHVGTGGGDHVVFGATQVSDSPFLRRPDLLKSMLIYWQRRPSLSYLFSGQFVGPSSQSPRVDEARHEALYELEIALAQVPPPGDNTPPPWLVDRLLRNLLADMSGNTHRAELCIDKLYAPQGPMGRLGLLELRALEMPPNVDMSLAQKVLLRALIAWMWRAPIDGALTRWGTALSDKFMLPEFVWTDFLAVLEDLRSAGYALNPNWFAAQRAFRFPVLGRTRTAGVDLTLRQALEPWHVLAEHFEDGGVSRPVDSALARVEICADGFDPARHALVCNGRRAPMTATDTVGRYVAGVRFKAWKPARGLHPTIDPHLPLRIELFDGWAGKAHAAFSYQGVFGGGLRPTSAEEAEAARLKRFVTETGESEGEAPPLAVNPEFPSTLDLRRGEARLRV